MSALGTQRISRLDLSIGRTGTWHAEAWSDEGVVTLGASTLTVGGLSFRGTTKRGGNDAPDAPHAVHEGAVGWEREIAKSTTGVDGTIITSTSSAISYQNDNGVRLRTVLTDLSKRAGETIEQPVDVSIGRHWVVIASRPGEPLRVRDALSALAQGRYVQPWRADPDGVTRFGERSGGVVDVASKTVTRRDMGAGWAEIGADTFADLLPGATWEGAVIGRLIISERPGNLSATVWTRAPSAMTSILRKVGERFPQLIYAQARTYRVGAVASDGRLDLDAPADAPHLPPLSRVEVWGLGGARVKPRVGSLAVVWFRDANPSRPTVIGLEPLANSTPTETSIDADAIKMGGALDNAARYGDKVAIDPVTGVLSFVTSVARPSPSKVTL